ncbi:hypothetical protein ABPG74_006022 [Tetrahymena malaccensis]
MIEVNMEVLKSTRTQTKKKSFKQIDKYQIDMSRLIGESYTSKVYLAYLISNPTQVFACKIIDKKDVTSFDNLKKLVRKWKKFNHPNVIQVYDCYMTDHNIYLITEFCQQGYLFCAQQQKNWSYQQIISISNQIIQGSLYLSQQQIIDQVITPENILFQNGTPKIDISFQLNSIELLQKSYIPQRYKFLSPQIYEEDEYTNKSNVWSIGIILYQSFQGSDPFEEQFINLIQRLAAIHKTKTIQFSQNKPVSDEIKNLIQSMLQYQESERVTMEEIQNKFSDIANLHNDNKKSS